MLNRVNSILYVEDEKFIREELADFFKMFCTNIYTAKNGQEGLNLYHECNPDIIISDIKMPVMDGLEMIERIKEVDHKTPILLTTAFNDLKFLHHAIELQVDGYILKPVDLEKIEEKITKLIYLINLEKNQKTLVKEVEKSHQDMEAIFNFSKDGLAIVNFNSKVIKVNESLCNILVQPRERIINKKCHEILGLEDFCVDKEILEEIIENDQIIGIKKTIGNGKGEKINITLDAYLMPSRQEFLMSINLDNTI